MSPGGDKFYNVLFHFSGYVLNHVIHMEHGKKCIISVKVLTVV